MATRWRQLAPGPKIIRSAIGKIEVVKVSVGERRRLPS
jgi:hypothetical protein